MDPQPALLIALAAIVVIIKIPVATISIVFLGYYTFGWGKLREWFNNKGGSDFMPQDRLERPQILAIIVGLIGAVGSIVVSMFNIKIEQSFNITTFDGVVTILSYGLYIFVFYYLFREYKSTVAQIGKKSAKWYVIYLVLSCVSMMAVAALLGGFAIALAAVLFFTSKIWDFGFSGSGSGSSSGGSFPDYSCCSSCRRFSDGHCNDNPSAHISNPDQYRCGNYQRLK